MPDDQEITDERPQRHRAGAWVVLLMGVVGLGLCVIQWRGSFGQVFAKRTADFKTPSEIEEQQLQEMKTKDTDGDGLNDYEESRVYQTSPYLADSDSDGFGLGLSIVREAVSAMDGTLSIESRPEEGTTVSIVLRSAGNARPDI